MAMPVQRARLASTTGGQHMGIPHRTGQTWAAGIRPTGYWYRSPRRWLMPLVALWMLAQAGPAAAETWATRLGYPPDRRVLILHATEVGVCHEANQAACELLSQGHSGAVSAVVPAPWFADFAARCRDHSDHDVGLSLF
ncbi:MAG: hypothetical protein A2W31_09265 [Planctomycetes bacterium RBG_16_64_10]|nr:MAG: hypothetical protein A2W31_09265 [Planctomycetes bacterium RBG_16_64_10]